MSLSDHTPIDTLKKGLECLKVINELAEASELMEQDKGLEEKYRKAIEVLEDLENDNHYFCISFSTPEGNGHLNIDCNFYPSYNEVVSQIKEAFPRALKPSILNIMEMSKLQYKEWQRK